MRFWGTVMRGMVFGLLLANVLFASWHIYIDPLQQHSSNADSLLSNDVLADAAELMLLSETPEESLRWYAETVGNSAAGADVPAIETGNQSRYCVEIGPFENTATALEFMEAIGQEVPLVIESRQVISSIGYRVFLPPYENREVASMSMQELRSAFARNGITIETFLIAQGELQNGIALGLFSDQRNAANVKEQMLTLGYEVVVREEPRLVERYWVTGEHFDSKEDFEIRWASLEGIKASVDVAEKLCQTIALDTQFP